MNPPVMFFECEDTRDWVEVLVGPGETRTSKSERTNSEQEASGDAAHQRQQGWSEFFKYHMERFNKILEAKESMIKHLIVENKRLRDELDEIKQCHESNSQSPPAPPPQNDERFENFVAILKSMHGCGVCREILSSPYTLTDCGHTFCASCLNGVINSNLRTRIGYKHYYTCPECRVAIKSMPLQSFVVGHTVDALRGVLGLELPSAEQLSFAANDICALPTSIPRLRATGPPPRRLAPFPLSP
ncbi:hypothetical protein F5880DRAFT_1617248 [Lentinula raphanica]|nr:hypothetical protein F5880DRAFT_1617248 [Lentinula raphanica]